MREGDRGLAPRRIAAVGVAIIAASLLAGGALAPAATKAVPQALVGCWHHHAPALPVGTPAGVWLMKITRGGELSAFTPGTKNCGGEPDFTATVVVAGNQL